MWSVVQNKKWVSSLPVPLTWHYILFLNQTKQHVMFIYNKTYFIILVLLTPVFKLSQRCVYFNVTSSTYFYFIHWYLYSITSFIFCKIKFKGKTYRLYFDLRNTFTFQLGYSHKIYFYANRLYIRKLAKFLFFFASFNFLKLLQTVSSIKYIRPINIYTSRGLRFTNDCVYKKLGKVNI